MIVWILFECYPYEGEDVVSIHSSKAAADVALVAYAQANNCRQEALRVEQWEVSS